MQLDWLRESCTTVAVKKSMNMKNKNSASSKTTQCISLVCVAKRLCKAYHESFFKILSVFATTNFHVFRVEREGKAAFFAKQFSLAQEEKTFNMFTTREDDEVVRMTAATIFCRQSHVVQDKSLRS